MLARITLIIAGFLLALPASAANLMTFDNKAAFLSATEATSATGQLPNLSPTTVNSLKINDVTITTLSGALWFGAAGVIETDWTERLPGPDLAVNGKEDIQVDMDSPVYSFGFDFVEVEFDDWLNGTYVDSTFEVTLYNGATWIGSFSFNAPNDSAEFIGVSSDMLFNRVTIIETYGSNGNEFFGQFYTGANFIFDADEDGVFDNVDLCPGTIIPESVPTIRLGTNRWALADTDLSFDTTAPNGVGPSRSYSTADTAGCSCEQIIEAQGLGKGHSKFGCSISAMDDWVVSLNP